MPLIPFHGGPLQVVESQCPRRRLFGHVARIPLSVSALAIMRQSKTKPQRLPLFVALQRLEKSADVGKKQTPRNQGENDRVGDHLADDRKTDRHMKSHPNQREPTCPVVAAEHEDSCNESQ